GGGRADYDAQPKSDRRVVASACARLLGLLSSAPPRLGRRACRGAQDRDLDSATGRRSRGDGVAPGATQFLRVPAVGLPGGLPRGGRRGATGAGTERRS